jgi:hypothetical protein
MRKLEPYNALNTLQEIGRPQCFNKKSTTHAYFLVYVYFIVFFNQQDSTYFTFSTPAHVKTFRPACTVRTMHIQVVVLYILL